MRNSKEEFTNRVNKFKVGDPFASKTRQGAIVTEDHYNSIMTYIALAKKEGGKILIGGKKATVDTRCKNGWFINPTIIEGLPYNGKINQEEILGPLVTIMPFDTEEEVIEYANNTIYGLSSSIWTQNLTRAHRVAQKVDCGVTWINCWWEMDLRTSHGSVRNSGMRNEGGWDILKFFTTPKNVYVKL